MENEIINIYIKFAINLIIMAKRLCDFNDELKEIQSELDKFDNYDERTNNGSK